MNSNKPELSVDELRKKELSERIRKESLIDFHEYVNSVEFQEYWNCKMIIKPETRRRS